MALRRCPLYLSNVSRDPPSTPPPLFYASPRPRYPDVPHPSVRPVNKLVKLLIRRLEVVVDDDDVVHAGGLGVLELDLCLGEALLDAGLGLGAATAQALLEGVLRGGRDEDVARVDAGGLDLLDALLLPSASCLCDRRDLT